MLLTCLGMVLTIVILILRSLKCKSRRRVYRLPPGPRPWPVIGNLNLVGALPHRSIHELSNKYGELMHLRFGSYSVVVASSPEMAELFLKAHDLLFLDRPRTAAGKHAPPTTTRTSRGRPTARTGATRAASAPRSCSAPAASRRSSVAAHEAAHLLGAASSRRRDDDAPCASARTTCPRSA